MNIKSAKINNILVALDASPASLGALEIAAEMAAILDASLAGLFIEDEDLLSIANLPFAQEIRLHGQLHSPLEKHNLEQQMRLLSAKAQIELKHHAERCKVQWQFKNIRGKVIQELHNAAKEVDMISLGATGWSSNNSTTLGRCTKSLLTNIQQPCLIYPSKFKLGENIIVVISNINEMKQLLAPAINLSKRGPRPLTVVFYNNTDDINSFSHEMSDLLTSNKLAADMNFIEQNNLPDLISLLKKSSPRIVLMGSNAQLLKQYEICEFIEKIKAPLFLI